MHYAELSEALRKAATNSGVVNVHEARYLDDLARALDEGQGYVAITLDPDGLKIAPVSIDGSSQMTIRAKSTLRKIVHDVQIHSGTSKSSRSRTVDQG